MSGPVLFVPSVRRGNGSGHLSRCFALARALGDAAAVYIPEAAGPGERSAAELALSYPVEFERIRVLTALPEGMAFRLVVLDRRATAEAELAAWALRGPVACLDEGGPARASASYIIDMLPRLGTGSGRSLGPNLGSTGYLTLPERRRDPPEAFRRILVSFGGEDPAGLSGRFLAAALGSGLVRPEAVTLVSGALSRRGEPGEWPGVSVIGPVQDLRERLAGFDLVVTSFGLTAFEAAWAGCAVLLLNPSREHEALASRSGFRSLGVVRPRLAALRRFLGDPAGLVAATGTAAPAERLDLAPVLAAMEPRHAGSCPSCGEPLGRAVYRGARKTCLRCPRCGLVRMAWFGKRSDPYTDDAYFNESYKAQYGKTYEEDLPHLRLMASARLARIEALLPAGREGATVLDVGCAYGAFVAEAQSRGWTAVGTDVSATAVAYVKAEFGAPAFVADFAAPGTDGFCPRELDCLSMWYVIEHFDDLGHVLRKARSLLKDGGVLALSTPSCSGISARRNPASFWERSPDDHFTIWSPRTARGILKRHGFKVQRTVVTGHHPERFPWVGRNRKSPLWKAVDAFSRLFGWGDTFECYATKLPDR